MSPILVLLAVAAGGYYLTRLAPRVASRTAAASAGTFAGVKRPYARYEYPFEPEMSEREALLIFGVPEGDPRPSDQQLKEKYRQLVMDLHSDVAGGNEYLAAKINAAKDVLTKRP